MRNFAWYSNPLPVTLAHYADELRDTLGEDTGLVPWSEPSVEGLGAIGKLVRTVQLVTQRFSARPKSGSLLVLWPAFGYFDALTWIRQSKKASVSIIIHDVTPLRRQFGYGAFARAVFRLVVSRHGMSIICHTAAAASELTRLTGVVATILPHPVLQAPTPETRSSTMPVRVIGQYKGARLLTPLAEIAANNDGKSLEIWGRGWPAVAGWDVHDGFVSENKFEHLIASASCVVIPYAHFYQSGVMVRCLESLVPVVCSPHPQLSALYGDVWTGEVQDGNWSDATSRAQGVEGHVLSSVQAAAAAIAAREWRIFLSSTNPEVSSS